MTYRLDIRAYSDRIPPMKIDVILEPDLTADQLLEIGLLAERAGIHGLWVQNYATAPDPFMTLVPLARASQRLRLGVVVVSPQELHPLKLATSLLTLNEMTRGRASVVMGRGGEWVGVIGGELRPDVQALEEALSIVRRAARGEGRKRPLTLEGKRYRARYFRTPWLHDHAPALVYAGVTRDRMLAMAARVADGVMLADLGLPRVAAGRVRHAEEALAAAGRYRHELRISNFVGWHVKADPAAVAHEARRELVIRAWLMPDWLRAFLPEDEVAFVQEHKAAFLNAYRTRTGRIEGVPEDLVERLIDGFTIAAPLADIDKALARVREFAAAGLDELALRLHDDPADSIRIIGKHVIPALT
jgi:alkanesulfonate monooxygenase SsuD/methylene tetrahydromethanopterin reductase-like flavin-dependent oxidoreductase (luciferase family)